MTMSPYWLLGVLAVLGLMAEAAVSTRRGWTQRRSLSIMALAAICFTSAGLLTVKLNVFTGLLAAMSMYRVINMMRINQDRWRDAYLRKAARRTSVILAVLQALLILAATAWYRAASPDVSVVIMAAAAVQVATALIVLASAVRNIRKSTPKPNVSHFTDRELPTVSVCIPARNETDDLRACLQTVIANDYPKLEILVLDDCSHDRTPDIIKSFAQDGVRFVGGEDPRTDWLAKNQAYDMLLDQANGEYVIFCGVDVRMNTDAIRLLVTTLLERKKDMASVMPTRYGGGWKVALIQPMRYWWEIALPRRTFNRPPVLSTLWIIRKSAAHKLGVFESVKGAIVPEAVLARELIRKDAYSFLRSGSDFKVETAKRLRDQRDTALRMRYPQVKKRPELVMLLTMLELALLVGPFVLAIGGFWWDIGFAQILAAISAFMLVLTHVIIVTVTDPSNSLVAVLTLPFAVLGDLYVGNASMLKYEFSTVDWKGRNVCLPVLQAIPKLPTLKDT